MSKALVAWGPGRGQLETCGRKKNLNHRQFDVFSKFKLKIGGNEHRSSAVPVHTPHRASIPVGRVTDRQAWSSHRSFQIRKPWSVRQTIFLDSPTLSTGAPHARVRIAHRAWIPTSERRCGAAWSSHRSFSQDPLKKGSSSLRSHFETLSEIFRLDRVVFLMTLFMTKKNGDISWFGAYLKIPS